MANIIETVNRFRKIEEATAPKDDPAAVYLLDEIADIARQSPESAQAIADAVQKKLGVKSPVVKFKALRIIKHLCNKGCSQFQRCMQRHSSSVRELIHWRGEPDPFKGDVPNARVREFAKEVVEVMFNSTPVTNSTNTLAAQGKIQGFGSGGATDTSSTYLSSSGSGRYGGFSSSGSGSLQSSLAVAQQAASQLTRTAQQALGEGPIAAGIASAANAIGGLLQPQGYGSRLNDTPYRDNGYNNGATDYGGYAGGSSYAAPSVSASQVLGSEEALVDDITTPGGLRPLPDAADLRRFVDTASNMDGLRIAELLRAKMESPRWQVLLRALAALEAVLQRGSTQACGEVAVMFQSDADPVRKCLQSPQQQVQQLAAAVLKLLLGEEVQVPAAAAAAGGGSKRTAGAAKTAAAAAPMEDLLVDESPAPAAAAAAAPAGGIDLLGDLMGAEPAAAAPAAAAAASPADALLDGLGGGTPAAAPAALGGGDDLFGGLTVAAPPAAAAAAPAVGAPAATTAVPAASSNAPLDDIFAGLSTSSTSNLLGIGSPVHQQQQLGLQQFGLQQQHQQQQQPLLGGLIGQTDLLGDLNSPVKQSAFGLQQVQGNGIPQQQRFGVPGIPLPHQQQQQQWALPLQSSTVDVGATGGANLGLQQLHSQLSGAAISHGGGSGSGAAGWKSHNTASEAAFDFVFDEFKKH